MLTTLHALSPAAVFLAYFIASLAHPFGHQKRLSVQGNNRSGRSRRVACTILTTLVAATYILESILLACVLPGHAATSSDESLIFTLYSCLVWLLLFLGLLDCPPSDIRRSFLAAWTVALAFEAVFVVFGLLTPKLSGLARTGRVALQIARAAFLLILIGISFGNRLTRYAEKASDEEITPLLARIESHFSTSGAHHVNGDTCGSAQAEDLKAGDKDSTQSKSNNEYEDTDNEDEDNAEQGKLKKEWWVYTKAFAIFLPHLWPKESLKLQLHFPALGLCLLGHRALNVLVPLQLGVVVNVLRESGGSVPWLEVGVYVVLCLVDSSAGLSLILSWLWMPIGRNATEKLSAAAYNKVMNLSSDFHDSKKSGVLWKAVSRGEALSDLSYTIGFEMIPMSADLCIAVAVLGWLFGAYMSFIVAVASVLYLWATAKTIPLKTRCQRNLINAWESEYSQMTESSLNWTTVSYFNRIGYEQNRYKDAIKISQGKLIRYQVLALIVTAVRALVLELGMLAAAILAAYQISQGKRSVGDFVVLITYWAQLTLPLHYFANGFSKIAKSLVDAEKLLELLQTEPTVDNHTDAAEFVLKQGQVDFDRVCFSYDGKRQVADNLSFRVEPGQTVALVGETGGGKSTILKLLFRFYDVTSGNIMVDGQDIRHVTLESLRANIGCVPQDPVLFNQTILQNLRYAKLDASEEEVQAACKAVALHEKIMSFTKGYSEKVGERGVKLSGGELQRIAIARAILKNPKILLLDEATSSVDSETETIIQDSLKKLCAGRTTFVVAHRLSTIAHADLVMVIKNGRIIERGSHDRLMQVSGCYSKLWTRQLRLQTGNDRPRLRSRSPEKTTALVDDVTDCDVGSRKGLLQNKRQENRRSEEGYGSIEQAGDEGKAAQPVMDAKVRGRSPRRDDEACSRSDSMHKKNPSSNSSLRKDENTLQERRSRSTSSAPTTLKPDAPEFVPHRLPRNIPYLSGHTESPQNSDAHFRSESRIALSRAAIEGKENAPFSKEPSVTQSTSAIPSLSGEEFTRAGSSVPDGHRKRGKRTENASATTSSTEIQAFEPCRTSKKWQERKPAFNSRRDLSKSEPHASSEVNGTEGQGAEWESASYPGSRHCDRDEMSGRSRSSTHNEALLSTPRTNRDGRILNNHKTQHGKAEGESSEPCKARRS
ncbi:hypothetical protein EPUS_09163 [Endocarpon pusillum Z07020]|uniref:Heavy metal tolerance protein n=1 Tax=Endocarpon pusillum (strain Z07020 / HMAS-L-300199) TaxID=1263415 RepID=U1GD93_ENDPU|nr:uncharacterized protein EPUS_09163 [Endocarpon pusillum Z07020]ERF75567.1 hypothetical protein EPUS_09163 [Endocarpon pusillum Z07020]